MYEKLLGRSKMADKRGFKFSLYAYIDFSIPSFVASIDFVALRSVLQSVSARSCAPATSTPNSYIF